MQGDLLTVALEGPSFSGKTILINRSKMQTALITIPEYYELNNGTSLAGSNPQRDALGQTSFPAAVAESQIRICQTAKLV